MIIGSEIFYKKKVYNSLEWAKQNIDEAPDGAVFLADIHEHTKGRQERTWIFDKDQLAVTILLKPKNLEKIKSEEFELRLNQLNMAITLGILKSLCPFGIQLKWANDFCFEGKKLGGLLFQVVWENNQPRAIICGFALNVNNKAPNLNNSYYSAISLSEIIGKKVDKDFLLKDLLTNLNFFYEHWLENQSDSLFDQWKKAQYYLGKNITVHKNDGNIISGKFDDLLESGDIIVRTEKEDIRIPYSVVDIVF